MGTVTVVSFTTVFVTERWLRHRGTIARNTSWFQKLLSALAILFAIIGMIGLIILTCRNDIKYSKTHDACLVVFMLVLPFFTCFQNSSTDLLNIVPATFCRPSSSVGNTNAWGFTTVNTESSESHSGSSSPSSSSNLVLPSHSVSSATRRDTIPLLFVNGLSLSYTHSMSGVTRSISFLRSAHNIMQVRRRRLIWPRAWNPNRG
jgi:hypothetical protein